MLPFIIYRSLRFIDLQMTSYFERVHHLSMVNAEQNINFLHNYYLYNRKINDDVRNIQGQTDRGCQTPVLLKNEAAGF